MPTVLRPACQGHAQSSEGFAKRLRIRTIAAQDRRRLLLHGRLLRHGWLLLRCGLLLRRLLQGREERIGLLARVLALFHEQDVELALLAARFERCLDAVVDVPAIAGLVGDVLVTHACIRVEPIDLEGDAVLVEWSVLLDLESCGLEALLEQRARVTLVHGVIV